jgi:hypothetical protein
VLQIRDISHPNLLWSFRHHFGYSIEQVGAFTEPMMTVGGLVISPSPWHQELGLTKHGKQSVTTKLNTLIG